MWSNYDICRLNLNTVITLKYLSSNMAMNIPIDPQTIMHVAIMIIWLAHWTGTMSFSVDVLQLFPLASSYFLKDKCPRNTVSWSATESGQIPEVIFYWAILIRFPESFGIIQHFCSNRKTLYDTKFDCSLDSSPLNIYKSVSTLNMSTPRFM